MHGVTFSFVFLEDFNYSLTLLVQYKYTVYLSEFMK